MNNTINVNIPDEMLETSAKEAMQKLFEPSNYNNPVKQIIEKAFQNYSNDEQSIALRKVLKEKVDDFITQYLESEEMHIHIGQAVANLIVDNAFKKMNEKRWVIQLPDLLVSQQIRACL